MKRTIYTTIVLDSRRDMYESGHNQDHDAPFERAYREAAHKLQSAVNRRLGGHRVEIDVIPGSYDGPEMQRDSQPDWPDGESLWQRLHDMVTLIDSENPARWTAGEPDGRDVAELRDWAMGQIHDGARNGERSAAAAPVCPHCGGTLKPNTLRHAHSGAGSEDYVCERCDVYVSKADADG